MNYEESLSFINSRLIFGSKPGLERVSALLSLVSNPQNSLSFIHIAGTNGKGSTATFVSNILSNNGLKVGLYTSPYVLDFRERFSINGEMISKDTLAEITTYLMPYIELMGDEITEFELITVIAFIYFKQQKCDVVVLETGLGGRLDATNVITSPLCSVITSISFDHTQYLGDTTSKIAAEKCGIIKENSRVVLYPLLENDALIVATETAKEKNCTIFIPNLSDELEIIKQNFTGSEIIYKGLHLNIPLLGEHQIYNCITAVETVLSIKDIFKIENINIINGVLNSYIPARFEVVSKSPLVIIDGAHNEDGIVKLYNLLRKTDKKIVTIMGVLSDKNYEFIISKIASISHKFIAITPNNPRALSAFDSYSIATEHCKNSFYINDFFKACKFALQDIDEDTLVLVCGSLYIAGEFKKILQSLI